MFSRLSTSLSNFVDATDVIIMMMTVMMTMMMMLNKNSFASFFINLYIG